MFGSSAVENVRYTPWRGHQHPTLTLMRQQLEQDGLRAYMMKHKGNHRLAVRSHGFSKAIFCVEGKVEVILPDSRRRLTLQIGDRLDIGSGVRHGITVGSAGAVILEGTPRRIANHT